MRGFLESFRDLTQRARGRLTAADLRAAGNTSREMQGIGCDREVERARGAYAAATKRFQVFWESRLPID